MYLFFKKENLENKKGRMYLEMWSMLQVDGPVRKQVR